ncbi:MAG TPA: hypothetical protein DCW90_09705 [Lachnospiraceae bacterium]|nr:hypothetical protein [Lachnospiraceae bacterium]
MKVYAVYFDNGEAWEDNYFDVQCLFRNREDAVKYIEAEGYVKDKKNTFREQWVQEQWDEYEDEDGEIVKYIYSTEYMYIEEKDLF